MIELSLIGIGTGNPRHLTLQAIDTMNAADVIVIPRKGAGKDDLAGLRRAICETHLTGSTRLVEFDLPRRDATGPDYRAGVETWHDAIAATWEQTLRDALPSGGRAGFLVWGDPALYDSTMRIAGRLARRMEIRMEVIPGITAIAALTATHRIPLNRIGAPVLITTGRRLREEGWPAGTGSLVVMLDGDCSFRCLDPRGILIWWAAYAGMPQEIRLAGPLSDTAAQIVAARAEARARHGWIMDIYLLRRESA
ncbi:precorrin-6A synthase (deacetylating) [Celeribacter indicus]|uniref:Precorrin-6A synthase [deacetylating] n=1 Tax=Celeribacter indicus TaxID=1208324 RepID=A0A0B5DWU8_9RHOB|nr:precorrin-6A synthase (deacetylating) [Celeribacter indicus]AJE45196.1 precorrin 6A synthase [Celeribacter indicus]SDX45065.1 precorrin-6A synthase (deacetylating) [Celeribacter indicus]